MFETALEVSGEDYNVYVPVMNSLGALGKEEIRRKFLLRCVAALENHLKQVPEDARARILIGGALRGNQSPGRCASRNRSGDDAARQRSFDFVQRRVQLLPAQNQSRSPRCPPQSLGSRLQRRHLGPPRSGSQPTPRRPRIRPPVSAVAAGAVVLVGAPTLVDPLRQFLVISP